MATKYISLIDCIVAEIIPDFDPVFPEVPVSMRYAPDFLAQCIIRTDEQIAEEGIELGMLYDAETDTFKAPPEPEPGPVFPPPEPEQGQTTWTERIDTLEKENKVLSTKLDAAIQSNQMLENCMVEMAGVVYA